MQGLRFLPRNRRCRDGDAAACAQQPAHVSDAHPSESDDVYVQADRSKPWDLTRRDSGRTFDGDVAQFTLA